MNGLDPRLFNEDEVEFLTGYARPWRRFKRALLYLSMMAATLCTGGAVLFLLFWLKHRYLT